MRLTKTLICVCFATLCYTVAQAQLSLSSAFTDHMVLQQKTDVAIWGWAYPGKTIRIVASWNEKDTVIIKTSSLGKWSTTIATPEAGGPYTIQVWDSSKEPNKIELKDVLIGEVWLCSGQSNMEWNHTHNISNKEKEIAAANHPNLRIFHIPMRADEEPQNSCDAEWERCTPTSMTHTSAVGYYFGRELMQKMDVPVGIIVSAWGGTTAEVWIPEGVFTTNPTLKENRSNKSNASGIMYNQMINPIVPYSLSGAIWYQGESNVAKAHSYGLLMTRLIESWRGAFREEFPFYFVQIAPFKYGTVDSLSATLREQQELTAKYVPRTGMVVISDLVDNVADIHPMNKLDVGIRLANMAMAQTYNLPIESHRSPTYKSVEFKNGKAYVSFNDVVTELEIRGTEAVGLTIAGADGKFVPARASVKDGMIIVEAKDVKSVENPTAVRYCFDNATIGNLFTVEGLPIAPFRSDSRTPMLQ